MATEPPWEVFGQLIAQVARVRDEVMPAFILLGTPGENALRNMRRQLDSAMHALLRHDRERAAVLVAALRVQQAPGGSDHRVKVGGR